MLEKLDSIPWHTLRNAYGYATGAPDDIRSLASPNEHERQDACRRLGSTIIHQSSIYEAAIYAMPFLIELLQEKTVQDKDKILALINDLATGGSWHENHYDYMSDRRETPDYQNNMKVEKEWVVRLRVAIEAHAAVYFQFLESPDPKICRNAFQLLLSLPGQRSLVIPALKNRLTCEKDENLRAYLYLSLGYIDASDDGLFFLQAFEREDGIPKKAAAITVAFKMKKLTPPSISRFLSEKILKVDIESIRSYSSTGHVYISDLSRALVATGPEVVTPVLPGFIEYFQKNPDYTNCSALFFMAFCSEGSPKIPEVMKNLSPLHRRVILVTMELFYSNQLRDADVISIFEYFGLTGSPEDIDKLLGLPDEHHEGFAAVARRRKEMFARSKKVLDSALPKKPWWQVW